MPVPAKYVEDVIQAMSIKYNNRVYEMQRQGVDVTVLSLGEAFFDIPLYPFETLPQPAIYHYSHSRGIPELRGKLARYYGAQYGVPVEPDTEILVTAGSKAAIHMALMAILSPGDEAIIFEPAWVSYPEQVRLCHAKPVMVPCFQTVRDVEQYLTPRTKVIIVNNPNNPRGSLLSREDLAFLHDLAVRRDLFLLSDEAYSDFVLDKREFISLGVIDPDKSHSIICNSMSKNYGMSGWRIGYVITNPALAFQILKINQHLLTCPSTILEYYLARHFDDILAITKPQIRAVVEKRREVARAMDELGLQYLPGNGTFYFFVSLGDSELTSEAFCDRLLEEHHVSVVPGVGYGESCDGFVRVSVGTETMGVTLRGIGALKDLVDATSARTKVMRVVQAESPDIAGRSACHQTRGAKGL